MKHTAKRPSEKHFSDGLSVFSAPPAAPQARNPFFGISNKKGATTRCKPYAARL
ncbi:hypothetical protein HMPREF9123_2423 [Neisseria bacilliformis ATCC BAA-1200]|uniref:Uncharacterized protein n=1 Tax=Neisseria bacilliformis ATCC BAA-1200 TaxID=888742 RepID=F2BFB6_9NEIS|nr:hypothetical protein HMPREF9123_2423 [Neisseria bacilliformis ATCC BAA-1200]